MKRAVVMVLLVVGCGKVNPVDVDAAPLDAPVMPDPSKTEVVLVSNAANRDLDVLFVIDDSPTMLDKQANLRTSFASFATALSAGGLPNLHLGVVTTDMGTRGTDEPALATMIGSGPGSCNGNGKNGNLYTSAATSAVVNGNFINTSPSNLAANTSLEQAFEAFASVGANGCGFEQPLQAMQRALANNPSNAGFLRPSARLGIIFLADEDDCSFKTPALLDPNATATLGALQSFRCTRFGVTCDVGGTTSNDMNQVGAKGNCHSNETSALMSDVGRFTTFVAGLKADPREIAVGALIGDVTPFQVELRTPPGGGTALPAVAHSCMYMATGGSTELGDPGVRIAEFARSMPSHLVAGVCNADLDTPMTKLATLLKPLVGDACLQRDIAQPAQCEAFDIVGSELRLLPMCDANKTPPCFELVSDPVVCTSGSQHLRVSILRGATTAADWTSVRCQL